MFLYQPYHIFILFELKTVQVILKKNLLLIQNGIPFSKIKSLIKINKNETVYVTEGPFDSCFLPNALAMCGSDVDHRNLEYDSRIWVFDNEPRNKQIVQRMQSSIQSKESIVIWPKNLIQKDINDMVLAGENPYAIIKSNTYSGLEAQIKFTDWKKV